MRAIRVEKVTLNIGAGKEADKLEKGIKLIKNITGRMPVKTHAKKRIPNWGLRPGLPIGCKLTLRKKEALALLKRLLQARDNKLIKKQFDNEGNIAFGIKEYIDIPGVNYDPEIGIMGLEVCITLERPGFRVKRRRIRKARIKAQRIAREDSINFMAADFGVKIQEAEI